MPKKLYPSEPAVFFHALFDEICAMPREVDEPEFSVKIVDPVYTSWAQELSDQHFPVQSELPLD